MSRIDRRTLLASGAAFLAAPQVARAQAPVTIKMGALKLIHSIAPHFYERFTPAGYKVEVIPFESPTEGKNARRHQVGRFRHVRHRRRRPLAPRPSEPVERDRRRAATRAWR